MLRTVLAGVQAKAWPLEKELELAHALLDLHLLRDKDLFQLDWRVPTPVPVALVPPMCLLTLVENAVKHGPGAGHRGPLSVVVEATPAAVTVTVENPGPFKGPRPGSHGLPTLERHLKLISQGATLEIGASAESRTRARLFLPQGATA
jgi:two-component system sensor histidine kinase AlgZ